MTEKIAKKKKLTPKADRYARVQPKSYRERYPEYEMGACKEPSKPVKTLPTFSLSSREVPEVADWKQGEEYMMRVRMSGRDERTVERDGKTTKTVDGRFEVVAVATQDAPDDEDQE